MFQIGSCQKPAYVNYNIDNGLASNEVYDILEDSKGYLWFATDQGVSKYNGYEFKNLTISDGLPNNTIFQLYEDHNNKIWLSSLNGQLSYILNDSIHIILPQHHFGQLRTIYVDLADTIWITSRSGQYKVYLLESGEYTFTPLDKKKFFTQIDTTPGGTIVSDLRIDSVNQEFFYQINGETYSFIFSDVFNDESIHPKNKKKSTTLAATNGFNKTASEAWVNLGNYVLSLSKDTVKIITKTESPQTILQLSRETNFITSCFGACVLDDTGNISKTYLKGLHVTCSVKDREGGYWFSTISQGVFYTNSPMVNSFEMGPNSKITDLIKNKNNEMLAITYFTDVYKQDSTGRFSKIYENEHNDSEYLVTKHKPDGTLLIEAYEHSILIKGNKTFQLTKTPIWEDLGNGFEYRPGYHSLLIRDKKSSEIVLSPKHPRKLKHYPPNVHNGVIYIPTLQGLYMFDMVNGLVNFSEKYGFPIGRVNASRIDKYGKLWVASNVFGLVCWDGNTLVRINDQYTQFGNMCRSLEIGDNYAWASTNKGLLKVDLLDYKKVEFFNTNHGILSIGTRCIYVDDEYIFLGHGNGVTQFPKNYKKRSISPLVYIDEVRINGQQSVNKQNCILQYDTEQLNIDFTGISYNSELRYKYRLKSESDNVWNYTKERNVEFISIPPGDYVFEVIAINSENLESEPNQIKILIKPPFWMTNSFILLVIVFIIGAIFLFIRSRIIKLNKKFNLEKKILYIEQQALHARMNPHFIFNALNSIQAYILSNDKRSASKYMSLFSSLIRSILDFSDEKLIPIEYEIKLLRSYLALESLRFNKKLNYEIKVSEQLDSLQYMIPPLLLQPYVENAILHGILGKDKSGKVTISFSPYKNHILFVITDDGIGREEAKRIKQNRAIQHKSVGTKITADRIDLSKALYGVNFSVKTIDLKDQNKPIGTRVEIRIPYLKNENESTNH